MSSVTKAKTPTKTGAVHLLSLDARQITLNLPAADTCDSTFVLAVHKSGSVLFEGIVKDMSAAANRALFDLEPQLFRQGVPLGDCPLEAALLLEQRGFVFTGFRAPWLLASIRQYRESKKLLIVRDPRDIAVSFYFSMARSHTLPREGAAREGILKLREEALHGDPSEFVLAGHVNAVFGNLTIFSEHVRRFRNFVTYRYEDVVFSKREWVRQIAKELDIDLPSAKLDAIADKHDVRPGNEDPGRHIRQVTPGNYQKHLSSAASKYIERRCARVFETFYS